MATVREHYDISAKALNAERQWDVTRDKGKTRVTALGKVSHCLEENAKYWSFYLPEGTDLGCLRYLLSQPNIADGIISYGEPDQEIGFSDTPERQKLSSLIFTQRVYLYINEHLTDSEFDAVHTLGKTLGFNIKIRDQKYVSKCAELAAPLAFICHDSNDKDELVRELALELDKQLCPVWYDEFSLKVGDSLLGSIEKGLKESKKCILVLSPSFLANNGWTKKEFNSIITREIYQNNNVILPVWHNVSPEQIYNYSPELLNRFALQSSLGAAGLAKKIAEKVKV